MVRCSNCKAVLTPTVTRCPRCGSAAPTLPLGDGTGVGVTNDVPARLLQRDTVIGHYRIEGLLGEGGMSAVYDAWDLELERPVALKALHPFLLGDRAIVRRFKQEGRIGRGWTHPHVGRVYDIVQDDGVLALVMERIDGPTLNALVESWRNGLPLPELADVAHGILAGLQAAHVRGIVHRDLKPGNILVEHREGVLHPRIIDFGIARVLEGTTYTLTGAVLGTCRYMSPEQVRAEPVGPPADVYSFGVVLYELATGWPPFEEQNAFALMMAHATKVPESPRELRTDLPVPLADLVLDLLAKAPEDRPDLATIQTRLEASLPRRERTRTPQGGEAPNGHLLCPVEAGPFQYGPEKREVHLDGFAIDRLPVTNAQFAAFLSATGYQPRDPTRFLAHWPTLDGPSASQRQHPVTFVDHEDAAAYCGWVGLRLPTEAEWERAARGTDGRKYPWGRDKPDPTRATFAQRATTVVDAHPSGASPVGALDLAGNVWEWTSDKDVPGVVRDGPHRNPRFPATADSAGVVVRGGSFFYGADGLRTTSRAVEPPTTRSNQVGFRCAR